MHLATHQMSTLTMRHQQSGDSRPVASLAALQDEGTRLSRAVWGCVCGDVLPIFAAEDFVVVNMGRTQTQTQTQTQTLTQTCRQASGQTDLETCLCLPDGEAF